MEDYERLIARAEKTLNLPSQSPGPAVGNKREVQLSVQVPSDLQAAVTAAAAAKEQSVATFVMDALEAALST
ncbi:MAG: hypothetical protein ACRDY2_09750 [Acidimicrobiales bacterium]